MTNQSRQVCFARAAPVACALGLALALCAGAAQAACNVTVSLARVQMGQVSVGALRAASVPGYKSIGARTQSINAGCDTAQPAFRVEFSGLAGVIGKPLLRWGAVGAMQLRVTGASVGGHPVNVKLESAPASAWAQTAELAQNDVLVLDVAALPALERKSLSVQLQVTGLLPEDYAVTSALVLDSNIQVQLAGAQ